MMEKDLLEAFAALKTLLRAHLSRLTVTRDTAKDFHVETKTAVHRGKPLYLAGVSIKKNYVSYYLMPAYMYPDLLTRISPALERRKQGKACFNFTKKDDALFRELRALTSAGMKRFRSQGLSALG
jgi:hypothetical protein